MNRLCACGILVCNHKTRNNNLHFIYFIKNTYTRHSERMKHLGRVKMPHVTFSFDICQKLSEVDVFLLIIDGGKSLCILNKLKKHHRIHFGTPMVRCLQFISKIWASISILCSCCNNSTINLKNNRFSKLLYQKKKKIRVVGNFEWS